MSRLPGCVGYHYYHHGHHHDRPGHHHPVGPHALRPVAEQQARRDPRSPDDVLPEAVPGRAGGGRVSPRLLSGGPGRGDTGEFDPFVVTLISIIIEVKGRLVDIGEENIVVPDICHCQLFAAVGWLTSTGTYVSTSSGPRTAARSSSSTASALRA